jgi:acyl-coenzyme A thioesterase PaaI-like protein
MTSVSPTRVSQELRETHVIHELGFAPMRGEGEYRGTAEIVPEMWVPGTEQIHTSILVTWADMATGFLAVDLQSPRIPVTLELDVHVYPARRHEGRIEAVSRVVKAGRSVVVSSVEFVDGNGAPLAFGAASFMAAPNPAHVFAEDFDPAVVERVGSRLRMPFAERVGCEVREPGVAVLAKTPDSVNSTDTIQGGLVSLACEQAVLSLEPGATLSSMALRYLRPVRVGPAVATASVIAGIGQVEVRDAGDDDRLAVVATTRSTRGEEEHARRD